MAIFNEQLHPEKKIVNNLKNLGKISKALQGIGSTIVVTIGSWDLLHIGHLRYLFRAKNLGHILVVGVDSDRAIKLYKGPSRPIAPLDERLEMLSYQSCVDFVTTIDDVDDKGNWQYKLIKAIRPDIFVAVEDSYPPEQQQDIKKFCGKLEVLPRQAEQTSTSYTIQELLKKELISQRKRLGRSG